MRWWDIARTQGGAISHDQLLMGGLSHAKVGRLARSGELLRVCHGVYVAGGAPFTYLSRLWSAQLATGGVLSYTTAGRLWGVYDGDDPVVHVTVAPHRRIAAPVNTRVIRSALPPGAVRERSRLPVTAREWTVLDLLGGLPRAEALRLADRAVQRGWLDERSCERRLAEHPKRRGNAQLRHVARRLGDGAAAESERLLHQLLRRAGITGWVANQEIWSDGELLGVVDVTVPARRIAIEVDGMAYHVDVDRFRRDRAKQNALVALGWTVLRFTWADLTERPGYVVAMLRRLAA